MLTLELVKHGAHQRDIRISHPGLFPATWFMDISGAIPYEYQPPTMAEISRTFYQAQLRIQKDAEFRKCLGSGEEPDSGNVKLCMACEGTGLN